MRLDTPLKVADRRFNAGLHRFAGQVVTAKHDVYSETREVLLRTQAGIDNARMRASRKYRYTPASHTGRDEAFVHDQRIWFASVPMKRVVTGKTSLVAGDAIDRAAAEEEAIADGMGIISRLDFSAARCEDIEGRLRRKHDHQPARQENPALIRTVRMQINDRSR